MSMMDELITIKNEIKHSIEELGGNVSGGMITYGEAIRGLRVGEIILPPNIKFSNSTFTTIPYINTNGYTDTKDMFSNCRQLVELESFDTSGVVDMRYMFTNCIALKTLPVLDCSSVQIFDIFGHKGGGFSTLNITNVGGFLNLGKSVRNGKIITFYLLNTSRTSWVNIFNSLYNMKSNNMSNLNIQMNTNNMRKLLDSDIAIVTNKGWIISAV